MPAHLALLALTWTAWCAVHSMLIAGSVQQALVRRLGRYAGWYRFSYVVFSAASLLPVLLLQRATPSHALWEPSLPLVLLSWIFIIAGVTLLVLGAREYDHLHFFGLAQLRAVRHADTDHVESDPELTSGTAELQTRGILRHVRHPYYSGGVLILLGWLDGTDVTLTAVAVLIGYTVLGTILEERKLVRLHGDAYRRYQKAVPMLLPRLRPRSGSA